ncbi:MAG TPA: hypothetical protein VKG26_07695 [Bacteroidia bacterium]|nr:hypothetical protein [Bacteroidia bacterium]
MQLETNIIKTKVTEIWVDNDGILRAKILEEAEMNEEAFEECFAVYKQLCEKKRLQLIDAQAYCTITEDGKKYSAIHSPNYFTATALITNNLAVRLPAMFYTSFHKHSVPFQFFKTEKEALNWLQQYTK